MGVLFLYLNLFFLFSLVCLAQNSVGHLDSGWMAGWLAGWMDGWIDRYIEKDSQLTSQ